MQRNFKNGRQEVKAALMLSVLFFASHSGAVTFSPSGKAGAVSGTAREQFQENRTRTRKIEKELKELDGRVTLTTAELNQIADHLVLIDGEIKGLTKVVSAQSEILRSDQAEKFLKMLNHELMSKEAEAAKLSRAEFRTQENLERFQREARDLRARLKAERKQVSKITKALRAELIQSKGKRNEKLKADFIEKKSMKNLLTLLVAKLDLLVAKINPKIYVQTEQWLGELKNQLKARQAKRALSTNLNTAKKIKTQTNPESLSEANQI